MTEQAPTDAKSAIEHLKLDVKKLHSDDITSLVANAHYIDTEHLSEADRKAVIDAYRQNGYDKNRDGTIKNDDQLIAIAQGQAGEYIPGTNIICYNQRLLKEQNLDAEVVLAHELGHEAIRRGYVTMGPGASEESPADNFAARVTDPQRVVDMLQNMAIHDPINNQIFTDKVARAFDPGHHGTAYERALAIQADFPESRIDLKNFPKPETHIAVDDTVDPVPLAPSEMPSKLSSGSAGPVITEIRQLLAQLLAQPVDVPRPPEARPTPSAGQQRH